MQTAPDRAASSWLSPEFTRVVAILWVTGLALVYLIRYEAWLLPFQLAGFLSASLPTLHVGPYFREFWMARAGNFFCVAAIMAAAGGLGAVVVNGLVESRGLFAMLFALTAGFWVLAVLVLVLGMVSIAIVPYAFLVILCWLLPAPRKLARDLFISSEKIDAWGKVMVVCVVLAAALNLLGVFAPPFEYDELEYHLGALADYQRAGHIVFLPHNFYSNLPQLTEMLYLLAMTASSDIAAKLLHWSFGLLSAVAVYGVAQRLWSRKVGFTAAALFYCTPLVQDLSQTARIDLATTFFATLAFGALVVWSDEGFEDGWVWLSALCAGAAVATKWTAIPVVLLPAALMLVLRRRFILVAKYCLAVLAMAAPWLIKNWYLAGNPVYPLLYQWFPNPHWNVEQATVFAARHYPTFGWEAVGNFFTLPWNFSFVEGRAVPLLLMTAPLLLVVPRVERTAKRVGTLFLGAYAGWFLFTFRPWRFLFPALGLAALAGAYAIHKLGHDAVLQKVVRISITTIIALSLATLALSNLVDVEQIGRVPPQMNFTQYALGQFTRDEFVSRMGQGALEPIIWMNDHLPQNAKVLYIGEARVYYAQHPVLWSTAFDENPLTAMSRKANTGEQLLARLRARGVTDVYVNYSELARLRKGYHYMADANWSLIDDLLQHHAQVIHKLGTRTVYELTD
jgi:4-amino-4-deoxy-L-arabinose transferase-like glycosyltransferase